MEIETPVNNSNMKKRNLEEEEPSNEEVPEPKKAKVLSLKQIRKQLHSSEKLNALKEFSSLLIGKSKHDFIFDYLKNGGNCLEIIQTLEGDSAIPPSLVFNLVTHLLLGINAKYTQYYNSALESCKYLINNYVPVIHKMLGLSSSKEERKICLKLLTAMAAISPNLAKDILLNVKFHSANIELLTKPTGEKNSVRDCFVHFLTAFLIDGDPHTLTILLEKSALLTSIVSGFQYDDADTVCIVITAMKNHVLENSSVMKTTKMHVFNTGVVKDIVNLYNWKGPEGLKALEKHNKSLVIEVDKLAKSRVSECVHDFLLILCTSHKAGVIFRDPLVGLGKKNSNGLMYTVLDSLDRPWEHSYASELVIKICRSCPDLTKNMWVILKPYLEPRFTEKWLNTMKFARQLIQTMEPACIEYCAKDLAPQQLANVIEILVSPAPILKLLLTENKEEKHNLKLHIFELIHHMLQQVNKFLTVLKTWVSAENYTKLACHISNYVAKHYPNAPRLLGYFQNMPIDVGQDEKRQYLETILDILSLYKQAAPELLHGLTSTNLDLKGLFPEDELLQIKMIGIFVDVDHSLFLPKTDLFSYIVPVLLRSFHQNKDKNIQLILGKLLEKTGIFDSNLNEISIWLNGIFNFSTFSENFGCDFVAIIRDTSENMLEYEKEISEIEIGQGTTADDEDFVQYLLSLSSDSRDDFGGKLKYRTFSSAILGLFKYCQQNAHSKNLKKYLEFVLVNLLHDQTNPQRFERILLKFQDLVPSHVLSYTSSWAQGHPADLPKVKGALNVFQNISEAFLNTALTADFLKDILYPSFLVDVLRLSTFYFANLVATGSANQNHVANWLFSVQRLIEHDLDEFCLELVLENPCLIEHFNVSHLGKGDAIDICSRALLEAVKSLKQSNLGLDSYLQRYSCKIFRNIAKILKNPKKFKVSRDIKEFLEVFPLGYGLCVKIINLIVNVDDPVFLDILAYALQRVLTSCKQSQEFPPIDSALLHKITSFVSDLNRENKDAADLVIALRQYLEFFPHSIANVDQGLFPSILKFPEYNKPLADLAVLLLGTNLELVKHLEENMSPLCEKKGLVLPMVRVLVSCDVPEGVLKQIYEKLEPSLAKALQKPQKVGQHFAKNSDVAVLIERFMPVDKCVGYAEKVLKFEVAEAFHARLLEAVFSKILKESAPNQKQASNMITTFIHLEVGVLKRKAETDEDLLKLGSMSSIFNRLLDELVGLKASINLETFKSFSKFALKFGVSEHGHVLAILRKLLQMVGDSLMKEDAAMLLDMLLSHSEFFNVVLGERSAPKLEVLLLIKTLYEQWSELMEKSHVAIVLASYRGLTTKCDRTALALLKLFESKPEQTRFYDFKPFLWGRAAATHYSVRSQAANSLTRQPKISDVLGILKEDLVKSTIISYPLQESLHHDKQLLTEDLRCYDLKFLLPLFSHILAPEQQVKTYEFTRSGALSLTILGLAYKDEQVRQAACHVLSRLHFHLEARQTGKDNLLWIRFLEALCKGVALLPDFKLNSFAAIFFARMALILTNPKHVMFTPLTSYLTAKQDLDLKTVPELYTLLFSSDVNFKEHRIFILEILRDGMRTKKDFLDFLKSMGLKLFSELLSSCLSDFECKLLILDVLGAICKVPLGVKMLIEKCSLLPQLSVIVSDIEPLEKLFEIMLSIVKTKSDKYSSQAIFDIAQTILESKLGDIERLFEILYVVYTNCPSVIRDKSAFIEQLTLKCQDRFCNYLKQYGCSFVSENSIESQGSLGFLRLLIYRMLK